jgi:hypothetical protein
MKLFFSSRQQLLSNHVCGQLNAIDDKIWASQGTALKRGETVNAKDGVSVLQ